MLKTSKKIHGLALFVAYLIFFIIFCKYLYDDNMITLLLASNVLFITLILHTFTNIKYYIINLIFYISTYIFLLSRPTIDYFRLGYITRYNSQTVKFSLIILIIAVISIFIGSVVTTQFYKNKKVKIKLYKKNYLQSIRFVCVIFYFFTYPCLILMNIEKVLYKIKVKDYYVYFATFKSHLPTIITYLGNFAIFILVLYLATKPKKLYATLFLISYVFSNFLILIVGTRNPFILSLLFSFVYYFIRNAQEKGKWIGRKEKKLIYIFTIPIVLLMGALNYIRDNAKVVNFNIFDMLLDFLYAQGTSFNVLANGYIYQKDLPITEIRNYSFGSIIDTLYRGKLGNIIFDSAPLISTDKHQMAFESNSLAHHLSYLFFKDQYMNGHGIGDSYIIGNFLDFGYLGIFLIGIFLGFIFIYMLRKFYSGNIVLSTIFLIIVTEIFFMPRGSFSSVFSYIFTIGFWLIIFFVIFLAKLLIKNNNYLIRR